MRWMKHLTSAHQDGEITRVLEESGALAYGVYWLILEDIAGPMEGGPSMSPEATHSDQRWAQIAHVDPRLWRKCRETLGRKLLEITVVEGNRVRIRAPNLLKYKDEYSKKSGQTPVLNRAEGEQKQSTAAAAQTGTPPLPQSPLPESLAAIRECVPSADAQVANEIAVAARTRAPGASDSELAEAIRAAVKPGQYSAKLFLKTVPETIETLRARARDSPSRVIAVNGKSREDTLQEARRLWLEAPSEREWIESNFPEIRDSIELINVKDAS